MTVFSGKLNIEEVKKMITKRRANQDFRISMATLGIIGISLLLSPLPTKLQAAKPTAEEALDVLKKVSPSVVKVEVADGIKRVATGVVIDRDGYIMTTALISPRREKITVRTQEGRSYEGKYLGLDPVTRVALLQVEEKGLQPISFDNEKDILPGSWVAVVSISPEDTPAITQGIVSSIAEDRLRLNISVLPGSSGSPVVNRRGEMIGLLRGPYAEGQPVVFEFREREVVGSGYVIGRGETPVSGLAIAVPSKLVKKIAAEIKEKGRAERGWLGVSLEEEEGGLRISDVVSHSPAAQAGLREGDIIISLNGQEVQNAEFFARQVRNRHPGEEVILKIERRGKIQEVRVKLGAYPEEEAQRELEIRLPEFFRAVPPPPPPAPSERMRILERRRFIGVYPEEMSQELANYFGLKEGRGLLVTKVEAGSPAEKAGIKVGDVITKADGERVETVDKLSSIIQKKRKEEKVNLEIIRDRKPFNLQVQVDEEESGSSFSWHGWTDFFRDWEKRSQELKERLKKIQQEHQLRAKENWQKISEEMERWRKEYNSRLKEYQEKAKEYREKIKATVKKRIIAC